jgi:hypothetical protein
MSFANSDALYATGDLSAAIGREYPNLRKHGVACAKARAEFRRSSVSWVFLLRLK